MNVLVHRGDGDAQTRGNLTVGAADANLLQDLSLARAQTTDAAFGTWWTARPNSIGRRSESGHRQPPDGADHLRHRHGLRNEGVGSRALAGPTLASTLALITATRSSGHLSTSCLVASIPSPPAPM